MLAGASQLGSALMMVFFATIGASTGSLSGLGSCVWLLLFIAVMCTGHVLVLGAAARLLKLPLDAVLVGSNATIGGPATAVGMTAAKGWRELMQPAMMCGSLGYAIGTGAGLLLLKLVT